MDNYFEKFFKICNIMALLRNKPDSFIMTMEKIMRLCADELVSVDEDKTESGVERGEGHCSN